MKGITDNTNKRTSPVKTSGTHGTSGTSGTSATSATHGASANHAAATNHAASANHATAGTSGTHATTATSATSATSGTHAASGIHAASANHAASGTHATSSTSATHATSGTHAISAASGAAAASGISGTHAASAAAAASGTHAASTASAIHANAATHAASGTSSVKSTAIYSAAQQGSVSGIDKLRGTVVIGIAPPEDRKEVLRRMIADTQASLQTAPPGSLIVRHPKRMKQGAQYYQRIPGKPAAEIYIPASNTALTRALAQKDYDRKALTLMEKQLNGMIRYNQPCLPGSLDTIYDALSAEEQALVTPAELTTKQYVELWLHTPYEQSRFDINPKRPNYTELGELVRSKSEVLIANTLYRAGLPYKYECPLTLNGKIIRPDYTILDTRTRREVYFEHCGIMDNPEYISDFLWKLDIYESANIFPGDGLLLTFESGEKSLNTRNLNKLIRHRFFTKTSLFEK